MRSPTIVSALLLVLSAAFPSPAQERADAIVEPSTKAPRGKLLEWKSAQVRLQWVVGPWVAALIPALLFAIAHVPSAVAAASPRVRSPGSSRSVWSS